MKVLLSLLEYIHRYYPSQERGLASLWEVKKPAPSRGRLAPGVVVPWVILSELPCLVCPARLE